MKSKKTNKALYCITNVCRFALAIVFIFSGFVKSVDPLGTAYKVEEYLNYWGIFNIPFNLYVGFSVLLSAIEFLIGIYLFFGIRRKTTSICVLIFMIIMSFLTLYIYIANPVEDCGCFGDALKLSNKDTFFKNIVLLIFCGIVFYRPLFQFRFISERNQWFVSIYSLFYILCFAFWSIYYLPILDFRPFKIGVDINKARVLPMSAQQPVYKTDFIFEKNGIKKYFTEENYPDSTWNFVESKTVLIEKGDEPLIKDFYVSDLESGNDRTENILNDTAYTFWLISPDLETVDDYPLDAINRIYDYCSDFNYKFYCITSSDKKTCIEWLTRMGVPIPILQADKTLLKTIIRSNPGLLLIKNGVIQNKWSKHDFPEEIQLIVPLEKNQLSITDAISSERKLLKIILVYIIPLFFITLVDRIWVGSKYYKRYKLHNLILTNKNDNEKENRSR